jgi:hypothetical protein
MNLDALYHILAARMRTANKPRKQPFAPGKNESIPIHNYLRLNNLSLKV